MSCMKPRFVLLTFAGALAIGACSAGRPGCSDTSDATAVVEQFGRRLQMVSLQSPTAKEDLRQQYSPFVAPALLDEWILALPAAPGRMVSSPWPDSIEVTSVEVLTAGRFSVSGTIQEMTSWELTHGGVAGQVPITMTVEEVEGVCLITQYQEVQGGD